MAFASSSDSQAGRRIAPEPSAPFLADFQAMSSFGATAAGGVERQAGSAAHGAVRGWLAGWLTERGFRVFRDRIGNLFGVREWVAGAPVVLVGSHLDSQPRGGRFDGAYGVLAAAHAADRLARTIDAGGLSPRYNVAVVDWFNEEGGRFKPSLMGSSVFTGKLDLEAALASEDHDGVSVASALEERGGPPLGELPAVASYAEIHVEQGRLLQDSGVQIGLVSSNWAAHKYEIVFHGEQSHTGSTQMRDRHDALAAAGLLIVAMRRLALDRPGDRLHTAISELYLEPNSPVTVVREVRLHLDVRSPEVAILQEADHAVRQSLESIEQETGVSAELKQAHFWEIQPYQPAGVELARQVVTDLGLPHQEMLTVAGHDSINMKDIAPTVMLFIPSVDGAAHCECELTHDEDLLAGVDVLTEVLARCVSGDDSISAIASASSA